VALWVAQLHPVFIDVFVRFIHSFPTGNISMKVSLWRTEYLQQYFSNCFWSSSFTLKVRWKQVYSASLVVLFSSMRHRYPSHLRCLYRMMFSILLSLVHFLMSSFVAMSLHENHKTFPCCRVTDMLLLITFS